MRWDRRAGGHGRTRAAGDRAASGLAAGGRAFGWLGGLAGKPAVRRRNKCKRKDHISYPVEIVSIGTWFVVGSNVLGSSGVIVAIWAIEPCLTYSVLLTHRILELRHIACSWFKPVPTLYTVASGPSLPYSAAAHSQTEDGGGG